VIHSDALAKQYGENGKILAARNWSAYRTQ